MAVIYLCPTDKRLSCPWEGYASEIKQHFEDEHNELLFHTDTVEIDLHKLPENQLLCLEEELFLMQNYQDNGKLAIKLRYLGSQRAASKIQYDITINVDKFSYRYEPSRYFSCIIPTNSGWEIDVECLEKFHGKLETLNCTLVLEKTVKIRRTSSDPPPRLNNQYVEKNAVDETETEENILKDLSFLDSKIKQLQQKEDYDKSKKRESCDLMDKISQLNFSMLEEPFAYKYEDEVLSYIPEEFNLSCSSCHLDMLPPIYICVNGHNVCSWCKSIPCDICSGVITINRNTDLENISRTHLHQCRYSSEGCVEKLLYNEVRAHEAKCRFCKYRCMSDDCPYQGKFDHFTNHLKVVHSSIKIGYTTKNEFPKNSELYVVNKSVGIFYCKSELINDFVIWKATFCGPSERQFFCELSFKNSRYKEPIFLKRKINVYEIKKPVTELKKSKAKEKYAVLTITSYDS